MYHEHTYDDATGEPAVCPVNGCWFNTDTHPYLITINCDGVDIPIYKDVEAQCPVCNSTFLASDKGDSHELHEANGEPAS